MARFEIRHTRERTPGPVSFWVHRPADPDREDEAWIRAERHLPPMPGPTPGRGYPNLHVHVGAVELHFASSAEVRHVIEVLAQNPLPSVARLCADRHPQAGPNRHWLSRWPASLASAEKRREVVRALERALASVAQSEPGF